MFKQIGYFIDGIKLKYAYRWIAGRGLSVVRLVKVAETVYIVGQDGTHHKIGKL